MQKNTFLEGLNDMKERFEICMIHIDGKILFPIRVMYKRNMKKIKRIKKINVMFIMFLILFILFMIFILFKHLYNIV